MDLTDFFVGKHRFEDLDIRPKGNFYWFYHSKQRRLITRFILAESPEVLHVCEVTLIKRQMSISLRGYAFPSVIATFPGNSRVYRWSALRMRCM